MAEGIDQLQSHEEEPQKEGRLFLSQGQGDKFDRWVEFISAIVLSLATVLTAWCGYQASLWGGEQAKAAAAASAARVMSAERSNTATLLGSMHVSLFVQYAAAVSQEDEALAEFLYARFPVPLRTATDAWLALEPLNNPDAPPSPFAMPEYHLPEQDEAAEYDQVAIQKTAEAGNANAQSDDFVRLTVIFATVLFFGGISGKFQWRVIDGVMLVMGAVVMLIGLFLIFQRPMLWG